MNASVLATPLEKKGPSSARAIFWAGLACGILDLIAALANAGNRGVEPVRVLRAIASALLGRDAMQGGAGTAALGLGMHFFVAFSAAAVFYLLSRKFPVLVNRPVSSGLVYGAVVYLGMNWLVIPLAALFRGLYLDDVTVTWPRLTWMGFGIHLLFVGLPISLAVRKCSASATGRT